MLKYLKVVVFYEALDAKTLPNRTEFIIGLKLSPLQKLLYNEMIKVMTAKAKADQAIKLANNQKVGKRLSGNPLEIFALGLKIWNHPFILTSEYDDRVKKGIAVSSKSDDVSWIADVLENPDNPLPENCKNFAAINKSYKLVLLNTMVAYFVEKCNEKMLVFSQSLNTLTMIRNILIAQHKNVRTFRLDGSTSLEERRKMIDEFQDPKNVEIPMVFLLSIKAGCLGINLTAATRVILYDVSWNPCHDAQAICRAYRIGQKKHVYIYRFVAQQTMEERVLQRQTGKISISERVVDQTSTFTKASREMLSHLFYYSEHEMKSPTLEETRQVVGDSDILLFNLLKVVHPYLARLPRMKETLFEKDNTKLSKKQKLQVIQRFNHDLRSGVLDDNDLEIDLKKRKIDYSTYVSQPYQGARYHHQLPVFQSGSAGQPQFFTPLVSLPAGVTPMNVFQPVQQPPFSQVLRPHYGADKNSQQQSFPKFDRSKPIENGTVIKVPVKTMMKFKPTINNSMAKRVKVAKPAEVVDLTLDSD